MNPRSLPRLHPLTGQPLVPVGYSRRGPIWPILGGSDDAGGTGDGQDGSDEDTPGDDKPAGDEGDEGEPPAGGTGNDGDPKSYDERHVRGLRDEAAKHRTRARTAEQERDALRKAHDEMSATLTAVRKAFGLDNAEDDPKTAAEKAQAAADAKDAELRTLRIERAAEKAGRKAGADVDALLDSRAFADKVAKLDPAADGFGEDLADLVEKALEANPRLKAEKPAAPPPSSAEMGDGGEAGRDAAPDDIDAIRAARRKRRSG